MLTITDKGRKHSRSRGVLKVEQIWTPDGTSFPEKVKAKFVFRKPFSFDLKLQMSTHYSIAARRSI